MQKHPGFGFKSTAFITPFCTSWTVCNVLRSDRKLYCIGNSPFSPELSSIACIQLNSIRSYNLLAVSSITTRLYGDGSLESQPPLRMSTSFCRFLWLGKASFFRDVLKRFKMSSGLLRTLDFNNSLRMLSGQGPFHYTDSSPWLHLAGIAEQGPHHVIIIWIFPFDQYCIRLRCEIWPHILAFIFTLCHITCQSCLLLS